MDDNELSLAIIGMSGRFPDARNVEQFWLNLVNGKKSLRALSADELSDEGIPPSLLRDEHYVRVAAPLDQIAEFDAALFGLTHEEAALIDPQYRLFLECAWEALEHAGCALDEQGVTAGVFAGAAFNRYLLKNLATRPDVLRKYGKRLVGACNEKDSLASLVAYKLNIRGPAVTLQTFSSTSLVAVHQACSSLLQRECDVALAGGVSVDVPQKRGYLAVEGDPFSPDGECYPFDQRAHGYVNGSGVAVIVLKRMRDAMRDRDTIHAVIRGTAVNNDGNQKSFFGAPSSQGQSRVIIEGLAAAGTSADTIQYVETHGLATALGDAIELDAMAKAFDLQTQKRRFCAIGSVKPNIGHLECAAGVTALIKTVQALVHRTFPPQLNCEQPRPELESSTSHFYVQRQPVAWLRSEGQPRRAGVSSFGLGGTNAHVVLEEAPEAGAPPTRQYWHLLVLSAQSEQALRRLCGNLASYLEANPELSLADTAYTLQIGRRALRYRTFVICHDLTQAISALKAGLSLVDSVQKNEPREARGASSANDASASGPKEQAERYAKLRDLAARWSSGGAVDWRSIHDMEPRRRIPLPTYPFERQRHWIDAASPRQNLKVEDLVELHWQL